MRCGSPKSSVRPWARQSLHRTQKLRRATNTYASMYTFGMDQHFICLIVSIANLHEIC